MSVVTELENSKERLDLEETELFLGEIFNGMPVKKVLLVNPPDVDSRDLNRNTAKRGGYYNFPPYGLGVVAKTLLTKGYEVKVCNLNQEVLKKCWESENPLNVDTNKIWRSRLLVEFNEFEPDIVGVGCLFTLTKIPFYQVCRELKKLPASWLGHDARVPLAVGGVHVSQYTDEVMEDLPEVDFAFPYESELVFLDFLEVVNKNQPITDLSQMVINTPFEVKKIPRAPLPPNAEKINITPDFGLLKIADYSKYGRVGSFDWTRDKEIPFATVLSNRGCRAACTFCNVRTLNGVGVRHRNVQSVIDELKLLRDKYGIGHISWLDDDLLSDEKRAISLFNQMVTQNVNMTWDAMNGLIAHSCTDEVISAAADSGCVGVNIGVESGNPYILKTIKKPGTVDTFLKASQIFKKYETINVRAFLMLGFPKETFRMILDTINLARQMDLDWYSTTVLQPWNGTPIHRTMVQLGLLDPKNEKMDGRYSAGPFGAQKKIENEVFFGSDSFFKLFEDENLDNIPSNDLLMNIWFFVNYYLNFYALFSEERVLKLEQQYKHLGNMCRVVAPENGFALYFKGYIQNRIYGEIDMGTIGRLERILAEAKSWRNIFADLGLSLNHLKEKSFPKILAPNPLFK
tara:strand:- start:559 stop:2445 length:1887 start_codon:yes stop_codon:yes gene_type:complete